jgi:hypothetical protein
VQPKTGRPILIRLGPQSTTVALADAPAEFRTVRHGAVHLSTLHAVAANATPGALVRVIRAVAQQVVERARLDGLTRKPGRVLGAEGLATALITLGAPGRTRATLEQVVAAMSTLADSWLTAKRESRAEAWMEPMMVGAAVLVSILERLGASEISVDEGDAASGGPAH